MDTQRAVGNISLQAALDNVGLVEVWIPAYIINDALDTADTVEQLVASVEEYVDEEYNFHDMYVFTTDSSRTLRKMFFNSNGLGNINAS